jgi:transcriptional regulator with XRE-family HTH domain
MKTTAKKLLGARIKELRKKRQFSQEHLSEKVDIDAKHLSRIEVGGSYPSIDTLENIAKALDVELKDFFEFSPLQELGSKQLKDNIRTLLEKADENNLRLILRIVKTITR